MDPSDDEAPNDNWPNAARGVAGVLESLPLRFVKQQDCPKSSVSQGTISIICGPCSPALPGTLEFVLQGRSDDGYRPVADGCDMLADSDRS